MSVDFYEEGTGLEKEDGGFTPHGSLALPLRLMGDEGHDDTHADDDDDDEDEEEEVEEGPPGGNPWDQARNCHYIRGYDPPHMRMPTDSVKYVFGDT